jgi:hypothetical protein
MPESTSRAPTPALAPAAAEQMPTLTSPEPGPSEAITLPPTSPLPASTGTDGPSAVPG